MPWEKYIIDQGLAIGLILVAIAFLWRSLWPWFTEVYWPGREKLNSRQQDNFEKIQEAIVTIKTVLINDANEGEWIQQKLTAIDQKQDILVMMMHRLERGKSSGVSEGPMSVKSDEPSLVVIEESKPALDTDKRSLDTDKL